MLKLYPYQKNLKAKFKAQKTRIAKAIGDLPIEHIGSTAVTGLGGKGIIDIMIGLDNWSQAPKVVKKLKLLGFRHIHPKNQERIFLSPKAQTVYGDTHIHLAIVESQPYREILAFRDYLRKNKIAAKKYYQLKKDLIKITAGKRPEYTKSKSHFINSILKRRIKK